MNDITKKTVERLKNFSESIDAGADLRECANCGWLLTGEPVVLVGLGLYCKPCAEKMKR